MSNRNLPRNGIITLTAHSPNNLPNAYFLETHAAVAQILHATGMGEYIDNILRERQLIRCFAPDGTTNVASLMMAF